MYLLKVIYLSADSKPKHQSLPGLYGTESWRGARTSNLPRHDGKPGECLLAEKGGGGGWSKKIGSRKEISIWNWEFKLLPYEIFEEELSQMYITATKCWNTMPSFVELSHATSLWVCFKT